MRRLVVEMSGRAYSKLHPERPLQKIKSMEVQHFLRFDHREVALIARVEFNKSNIRIEDVLRDDLVEVQLLEHEEGKEKEKESGICTYFIKAKLSQAIRGEPGLVGTTAVPAFK